MIGKTVQHYRIGERLGSGGMGEVYRAEDVRLGRPVALKFLPASLKADPESRARLLNEARAASLLRSPNIAVTYDLGEHGGTDFIVMEYVEGDLLSSRISQGPLPVREVIEVGMQVADALDEAHARGIVHRDIKSGNLMWTGRGLVKVLDFGLAKFLSPRFLPNRLRSPSRRSQQPGWCSARSRTCRRSRRWARTVDHRSDLFSLGVVMYEMATGRAPFVGGSATEIIDRILHEVPAPPSRYTPAVPQALDAVVARSLEKSPTFRYQSARELHDRSAADRPRLGQRPARHDEQPAGDRRRRSLASRARWR